MASVERGLKNRPLVQSAALLEKSGSILVPTLHKREAKGPNLSEQQSIQQNAGDAKPALTNRIIANRHNAKRA